MNRPLIAIAALSLAAIILSTVVLLRSGMTPATQGGKADIEETVRTLLREHPEIVDEALRVIMEKRRRAEEERQRLNLKAKAKELNEDPGSVVGGNPAGDVFMVEFFDY
ncbi:MAG: DsbA family protein, partial [Alphaproteobacteria bacterium]|nr:DsbA family protein [Alphaproteobacteria bacterium]